MASEISPTVARASTAAMITGMRLLPSRAAAPTASIAWLQAAASREAGLAVLVGAPNLVMGGSHSGNVAAIDLLQAGQADILSSDYVPASLMESVFRLPATDAGISLPQAVRLASLNPARAVGLADRGEIAPERRADLVRVHVLEGAPLIRTVWREGHRVV